MSNKSTINCPSCNANIDVNEILKHQLEDNIRKEYQIKSNIQNKEIELKNEALLRDRAEFELKKNRENELFAERLEKEKRAVEKELTTKLKASLEEENKDRLLLMQNELAEKSEKLRELNKMEGEIAKLQREKLEMKDVLEANNQKLLNEMLATERDKIRKQEDDKNE